MRFRFSLQRLFVGIALIALGVDVYSSYVRVPPRWPDFVLTEFETARANGRPVLVIVTANWTGSVATEEYLLRNNIAVRQAIRRHGIHARLIHADRMPDEHSWFKRQTKQIGVPAIAFWHGPQEARPIVFDDGLISSRDLATKLTEAMNRNNQ